MLSCVVVPGDFDDRSRSCGISSAGGAAIHSPRGAGRSRVPKAEGGVDTRRALRGRERPIPQILQAGQDEIGAGAGAVAVMVTREELGQAFLIGQVSGIRAAGSDIPVGLLGLITG